MAFSTTIDLRDTAVPALTRLAMAAEPEKMGQAAGPAVVNKVRSHFFALNAERSNKLGGKRTNFFNQAARSTQFKADRTGVVVSINHLGIRQRYLGGTIKPTGGRRFLTIPAIAEAYATRAGEWNNLKFGFAFDPKGNVRPALIEAQSTALKFGAKRKDGSRKVTATTRAGGQAVFWLVRGVTQRPDPSVLPTDQEIQDAALTGIAKYFQLVAQRKGRS